MADEQKTDAPTLPVVSANLVANAIAAELAFQINRERDQRDQFVAAALLIGLMAGFLYCKYRFDS